MTTRILVGNCLAVLRTLPEASVHCVVTSPPYWGLRDYGTGQWEGGDPACQHSVGRQVEDAKAPGAITTGQRPGVDASRCRRCGATRADEQIGLEPTIGLYLEKVVDVFREIRRVLRNDGTAWVNMGDSYAGSRCGGDSGATTLDGSVDSQDASKDARRVQRATFRRDRAITPRNDITQPGLKPKDLCGVPWRLAFALQDDGWWLRQDIIWHKPNPMPESVGDRCTKAHEYLFLLAKSERYYFDAEAICEPCESGPSDVRKMQESRERIGGKNKDLVDPYAKASSATNIGRKRSVGDGETRNRRSVWTIATEPFKGAHFATFPTALVEPCILAGCPRGGVVLDPFGGAGTTALVAERLQRHSVLIELNPDYAAMARQRIHSDAPLLSEVA